MSSRRKKGKSSYCRPLVNCSAACAGVAEIDVFDAEDIDREAFASRYAHRGQPLVVRNATQVRMRCSEYLLTKVEVDKKRKS